MIAMTKNYANHVFFDLGPEKDVLTAGKLNWDLGFEPGPAGWRIYLNTTRFMQAALSGNPAFESVKIQADLYGISTPPVVIRILCLWTMVYRHWSGYRA
jgi:hypothetical protein